MSRKPKKINNTEWNLSQLYKSPDDEKMEKDISLAEKAYVVFSDKYKNTDEYLKDHTALRNALSDYEKLLDIPVSKAIFYLHLASSMDSCDEKVRAKINLISQRMQKLGNLLVFFEVNLAKIPVPLQKKFLASEKLLKYRYYLKKIFEIGKYVLTEPEEKILALKFIPSRMLWEQAVRKIHDKQTIEHKGRRLPISEAESLIINIPAQKERRGLHNLVMNRYTEMADLAESEINAIVINKKIDDELRGYKEPYDATVLGYENDEKSVLNLVKTVTENFHVARKFYDVKAKMLKLDKLYYSDRAVPVGETKRKISYDESVTILSGLFYSIDKKFGDIFNDLIRNGQVDVYPKIGKSGGAYCSSDHKSPTFILLNHVDSFDSLRTLAHEMGHAIHSELSKSQPVLYEGYSTSTAEVASTLFETFLFYSQFKKFNDEEKIIALHDKIQDDITTIFRQIACFNFELEMHQTIRQKGNMTKEELAACMNKHMKAYQGGRFELTENDGYFFVGWSHIRSFFYVYTYAFGQLASKALYKKYLRDASYIEKIKTFLSAGSSMSPEDIFKSIGVDVTKPDFWRKGIESIEEDIKLLEKLIK